VERLQLTEKKGESQPQLKELKQQQLFAAYDGGGVAKKHGKHVSL